MSINEMTTSHLVQSISSFYFQLCEK